MKFTVIIILLLIFLLKLSTSCKKQFTPAQVYAPNSMTPNGDGINDHFNIRIIDSYVSSVELKIFDRNFHKIYTNFDYNVQWSGMIDGIKTPAGTYYWQLKYRLDTGIENYAEGHLQIYH